MFLQLVLLTTHLIIYYQSNHNYDNHLAYCKTFILFAEVMHLLKYKMKYNTSIFTSANFFLHRGLVDACKNSEEKERISQKDLKLLLLLQMVCSLACIFSSFKSLNDSFLHLLVSYKLIFNARSQCKPIQMFLCQAFWIPL